MFTVVVRHCKRSEAIQRISLYLFLLSSYLLIHIPSGMYRLVKTLSFCAHVRVAADDLKNRRCSARKRCCGKISTKRLFPKGIFLFSLLIRFLFSLD
jgi:hypothetical protein